MIIFSLLHVSSLQHKQHKDCALAYVLSELLKCHCGANNINHFPLFKHHNNHSEQEKD